MLTVGDWVQATEDISEPGFMGFELWVHALRGGVGHVMGVGSAEEMFTVTWERTGTTTDCHASELLRLCGYDFGRQQKR